MTLCRLTIRSTTGETIASWALEPDAKFYVDLPEPHLVARVELEPLKHRDERELLEDRDALGRLLEHVVTDEAVPAGEIRFRVTPSGTSALEATEFVPAELDETGEHLELVDRQVHDLGKRLDALEVTEENVDELRALLVRDNEARRDLVQRLESMVEFVNRIDELAGDVAELSTWRASWSGTMAELVPRVGRLEQVDAAAAELGLHERLETLERNRVHAEASIEERLNRRVEDLVEDNMQPVRASLTALERRPGENLDPRLEALEVAVRALSEWRELLAAAKVDAS